jgi:hypothetical protein
MRAKRPGANGNRGERDSGRNDPVPLALVQELVQDKKISHG